MPARIDRTDPTASPPPSPAWERPDWTPWRALPSDEGPTSAVWREILDGGQAFRWRYDHERGIWAGLWGSHAVRLRFTPAHGATLIEWSAPRGTKTREEDLRHYLALDLPWSQYADELPWRSDPILKEAIHSFPGLRLLRQPPEETLLGFLCSSTKPIWQIRILCDRLAENWGHVLLPGLHALPTWEALAHAGEDALRSIGLGYRARYISACARHFKDHPTWWTEWREAPREQREAMLIALPGVGAKIAHCQLLFGGGHLEAFPIDTWILQVLRKAYQLEDWSTAQLTQFASIHFGPRAGLAQQFLFAHARKR